MGDDCEFWPCARGACPSVAVFGLAVLGTLVGVLGVGGTLNQGTGVNSGSGAAITIRGAVADGWRWALTPYGLWQPWSVAGVAGLLLVAVGQGLAAAAAPRVEGGRLAAWADQGLGQPGARLRGAGSAADRTAEEAVLEAREALEQLRRRAASAELQASAVGAGWAGG